MKCLTTNIGTVPYENRQLFICDWRSIWSTLCKQWLFFFVVFLSILISFRFLSKFTACFLHCVRDAKIDEEKKQVFYSSFTVDILYRWCFIHFHQGLRKKCAVRNPETIGHCRTCEEKLHFCDRFEQIQKCTHFHHVLLLIWSLLLPCIGVHHVPRSSDSFLMDIKPDVFFVKRNLCELSVLVGFGNLTIL